MFYREHLKCDLSTCEVKVKDTDLLIKAEKQLYREGLKAVNKYRSQIEEYITRNKLFKETLQPIDVESDAYPIIKDMAEAATLCGVGPMAAVAGAIAEYVAKDLSRYTSELIIENGGDIFMNSQKVRIVSIFAGDSPFSEKIGLKIEPWETPLGICTSSGTVGHSLSFGKADAVTVISKSAILADAAATAVGNLVKGSEDFDKALSFAKAIKGINGILIISGKNLCVWGKLKIEQIL